MGLSNQDKENIDMLMRLGESIFSNIEILRNLDSSGFKESQEYKNTIICMNSTLDFENEIYNRIDPEKIYDYILYLNNDFKILINDYQQIEQLLNVDLTDICIKRILNRLYEKLSNNRQFINSDIQILSINSKTKEKNNLAFIDFVNINLAISKDIINTLLGIIDKELKISNSQETTLLLLKIKYYLSFLYPFIENEFLNKNYETNQNVYLTSESLAYNFNIDYKIYASYMRNHSQNLVIPNIIKIANSSSSNEKDLALRNFYSILLRCGLVFSEESIYNHIEEAVNKSISVKNMLTHKTDPNDYLILKCLTAAKKDKQILQIITLKLKKRES